MSLLDNDFEDLNSYKRQIRELTELISRGEDTVECLTDRAELYYLCGQISEAIKDYEKIISIDPNQASIYQSAAVCYADLDNFEKATEYCREALKLEPELLNDLMAEQSLTHIVFALMLEFKVKLGQKTDRRVNLDNTIPYLGLRNLEVKQN